MAYNLKDVFFLGATHEFAAGTYGSAGIEGNMPIDISGYVDPIARNKKKGQGLAVYKVHCQVAGDVTGNPQISTDAGQAVLGLTVKPYAVSGDNSSALESNDMTPESDLLIWGGYYTSPATAVPGQGSGLLPEVFCEPSAEVPYVCVRDTIFHCIETSVGMSGSDSYFVSYRIECAMIELNQSTVNQLLRTQTA